MSQTVNGFPSSTVWRWPLVEMEEVVSLHYGKALTEGDRRPGEMPVYGTNGRTGWHDTPLEVILGRKGMGNLGVEWCDEPFWVIDTAYYTRFSSSVLPRFFYYFTSYVGLNHLKDGTSNPSLSRDTFARQWLPLPPIEEQRRIVSTLGAIDDKIDLNRRMNETLEAMARAIFKDWFVDFGPTRAKAEGRPPSGLSAEIAALFPDALDDEDKPVGWESDRLGTFTELQNGYAFRSADWQEDGVPVVKIGSVKPSFVDLNAMSYVKVELAEALSSFRLKVGDLLVGLTGYVGETGRVPPTDNTPMLNQRVAKLLPKDSRFCFVYSCVRDPAFKAFAEQKAHGSAQPNVSTRDLLEYPVIGPSAPLLLVYEHLTTPLLNKSLANMGEVAVLSATRDVLLPKLMSGEIRLKQAEHAVEAVL